MTKEAKQALLLSIKEKAEAQAQEIRRLDFLWEVESQATGGRVTRSTYDKLQSAWREFNSLKATFEAVRDS